jgi:hypothetical protein
MVCVPIGHRTDGMIGGNAERWGQYQRSTPACRGTIQGLARGGVGSGRGLALTAVVCVWTACGGGWGLVVDQVLLFD